jgi:ATPase involved in DNA repair
MGIHYIKSIQLQNFGSYLETKEVLIPLGLTAVVGEHDVDPLRSNGVGKSTFVNSILYALYGEGEFTLVDELVNDKNKDKKMEVVLTFIDSAGKEICVRRGRQKGQSFITIYEDNQQIDAKGVAASQEYLLNVLQMDYNMFTSSVFFEQGKLDKFIDAEPSVRRSYVDKVLDLDIWRKGFKLLQSKTKKLETDKKTKEEVIGKLTIQKSELENELRLYSNVEQELENVKIKYTEIQDKVKSIESISTLITQLQDYEKRIQSSFKRISTYNTTLKSIQSQLDELEKEKLAIVQKLNEFESTNTDTDKLKEEIEVLMLKKSDIQHKIKKCEEAFSNSLALVSKYKAQQKSYENQLGKLKEGKCPTCFQTITQDYITQYNKPIQDKIKE